MIEAEDSWASFCGTARGFYLGTEHAVDLHVESHSVVKITIPPNFGLAPYLVSHPIVNLSGAAQMPAERLEIEFRSATPLEYLERWIDANEVFGDHVRLQRVVRWSDGLVSFLVIQPQYQGQPATDREIDGFFTRAGWQPLRSVSGHVLYYNYPYQVLAVDALPRNCYIHDGTFMPFDVILCRPDDALSDFLKLYPG